jgi:hypothetical protein
LEFIFLSNEINIDTAIEFNDVHLMGEIIHCLRVFGVQDSANAAMRKGLEFLQKQQLVDGSWPTRDDADDSYFRYHAAMCAVSALYPRRFRGYGPCEVKLLRVLQVMKFTTREGTREVNTQQFVDTKTDLADCVQRRSKLAADESKAVRALYEAQVQCMSHELPVSAEHYAFCRLEELKATKQRVSRVKSSSSNKSESGIAGEGSRSRRFKRLREEDEKAWHPEETA